MRESEKIRKKEDARKAKEAKAASRSSSHKALATVPANVPENSPCSSGDVLVSQSIDGASQVKAIDINISHASESGSSTLVAGDPDVNVMPDGAEACPSDHSSDELPEITPGRSVERKEKLVHTQASK